jgi:hypothetical protein
VSDPGELLGDWLERQLATAPPELALRVRTALPADWADAQLSAGAQLIADAATDELKQLLERGCDTRRAAPTLLAVDALVTYACEVAAASGVDLDATTTSIVTAVVSAAPPADSLA